MTAPQHVVVLAAGEGKRMKSALPKVLQPVAGRPMLAHVVDTARALDPAAIHVVFGHGGAQVRAAFADQADLRWAEQARQLGTAMPEHDMDRRRMQGTRGVDYVRQHRPRRDRLQHLGQ